MLMDRRGGFIRIDVDSPLQAKLLILSTTKRGQSMLQCGALNVNDDIVAVDLWR